jgi:CelD/BcsL family acetyltransferase involved in cellulose biosynthesis/predicted acetyltransferase
MMVAVHPAASEAGDARTFPARRADPASGWMIDVVRGWAAVVDAVGGVARREWERLVDESDRVAVYQSPGFVLTWYEVYDPEYEPLLLLGRSRDGALLGVMPLALPRRGGARLVFAGAEHCEYTGWLAAPALGDEFPVACVLRLAEAGLFTAPWRWRWLAPGASLAWIAHPALRARGIVGRVRETQNPLVRLQSPESTRFFDPQGKNFKRKMNRLKRLGEVRLVQLDAGTLSPALMERLQATYDVRQLARYGVAPFSEDPLKGEFHRRLIERAPASTLLFALMAGATPVAFNFTLVDRRRAIYCMSPFDYRQLAASPGKLIGDLVIGGLVARGFELLDQTPGGDAYKEEVASDHETIQGLMLYPSARAARRADARDRLPALAKRTAIALGVGAARVERAREAISGAGGLARFLLALPASLRRWAWSRRSALVYRLDLDASAPSPAGRPEAAMAREDAIEDFLGYTGSDPGLSRQAVMSRAIERLTAGQHCVTVVRDGVLARHGWVRPDAGVLELSESGLPYGLPSASAVTYDVHPDPTPEGYALDRLVERALVDTARQIGARHVFCTVDEDNVPSKRAKESAGYQKVSRLVHTRRLGRERGWSEPLVGDRLAPVPDRSGAGMARAAWRVAWRWLWSTDAYIVYALDPAAASRPPDGLRFRVDALDDFECFHGADRWMSRERLLANARARLAAGEHCWTVVEDGVLVHYAWLQLGRDSVHVTEVDAVFRSAAPMAVLYDAHTDQRARGRGLHRMSLRHRIDAARAAGATRVISGALETNIASRRNLESVGFAVEQRLVRRRVLGLRRPVVLEPGVARA